MIISLPASIEVRKPAPSGRRFTKNDGLATISFTMIGKTGIYYIVDQFLAACHDAALVPEPRPHQISMITAHDATGIMPILPLSFSYVIQISALKYYFALTICLRYMASK